VTSTAYAIPTTHRRTSSGGCAGASRSRHPGVREVSEDPCARTATESWQQSNSNLSNSNSRDATPRSASINHRGYGTLGEAVIRHDLPLLRWSHDRATTQRLARMIQNTHTNPREPKIEGLLGPKKKNS